MRKELMRAFRDISIRQKLTIIIMFTSCIVLLLSYAALITNDLITFRRKIVDDLSSLAEIIGSNCTASLTFTYELHASQTLAALSAEPRILFACIYTMEGELFAEYIRDDVKEGSPAPPIEEDVSDFFDLLNQSEEMQSKHNFGKNRLDLYQRIVLDGETIGILFIRSDLLEFYSRLKWYAVIGSFIMVFSLFVAYLLSSNLQHVISGPVLHLVQKMKIVSSDKTYSVRAEKESSDELGILVDGFNEMLEQIQVRDEQLGHQRERLEELVEERTADLKMEINERKRAEEALMKSERLYRDAIEVAGAVPYYQNYTNNSYEFVGEGIKTLTGYLQEEFTPEIWVSMELEMVLMGDLKGLSLDEAIRKARGSEGVSWRADYRVRTRGGEERWIANAAVQVCDDRGTVVGSLGMLQDITERKRLEEQLRHAHKMEAIGQLAGGVAHNINNLLTGIIGNLSLAERKAPQEIRKYLTKGRGISDRAASLVKQLLAFSRKFQSRLHPVDVNQVIEEVSRLARDTIDRRIDITVHTQENPVSVRADAAQLNAVLVNLCVNARDAINRIMNEGVAHERRGDKFEITIRTKTVEIDREYYQSHAYARPGRFLVFSVSDNGAGMDAETQRHIFEPFFTTKGLAEGTGLGLASAYGIVKQHNGWIDFDSKLGKGTTFNIYLPVAEEGFQKHEFKHPEEVRGGKETILLVDDEEMILDGGKEILESYGYTVLLATDGKEALDVYYKERDRIDLIVLDLWMPRLSGQEVLERLQVIAPDAKVIVSTGHDENNQREYLDGLGVAGYAPKPYQPSDLARTIRKVLDAAQQG